jgi:four helix bundle protein
MPFQDYKNLDIWKKSHELVVRLYKLTESFPNTERYRIIDQLLRAAVSIPTNIAEGSGRSTNKDKIHFLIISRGSVSEVEYLLFLSRDLKYINEEEYKILYSEITEIGKMLNGFINYLKTKPVN